MSFLILPRWLPLGLEIGCVQATKPKQLQTVTVTIPDHIAGQNRERLGGEASAARPDPSLELQALLDAEAGKPGSPTSHSPELSVTLQRYTALSELRRS